MILYYTVEARKFGLDLVRQFGRHTLKYLLSFSPRQAIQSCAIVMCQIKLWFYVVKMVLFQSIYNYIAIKSACYNLTNAIGEQGPDTLKFLCFSVEFDGIIHQEYLCA